MASAETEAPRLKPHTPLLLAPELPPLPIAVGPAPEHFNVEELPLYAASGSGEHHYVLVQKRCLTTPELVRRLARAARVDERDIGYAGLKDKHAVTTQWLSLPSKAQVSLELALGPEARVLEVTRHQNKLRTGHLLGNRFRLGLVPTAPGALLEASAAAPALELLRQRGLPNYFGAQRFGRGGRNLADAVAWLAAGARGRSRFEQKLFSSVIQSEAFNRYLSLRLAAGCERLLTGEVVRLQNSAAMFRVEDAPREQPRLEARDICLTGPLVGPKLRPAAAEALALEQRALEPLALSPEQLELLGRFAPGARRDLFAPIGELELRADEHDGAPLWLGFHLPAGAYATELVRQLSHAPFVGEARDEQSASALD